MAQPVWVLSVDLQSKTATFNSGMAEAAKSARGAFTDIKSGSSEMGTSVGSSMGSARQSVMLLGDEFGVHLPRGLTMFIASLGPVGAAMEAAFPFVAIALGATLLLEHLFKMHEAGEALTQDQVKFGTAAQNAFNTLDQKLLQAQIRSDELHNNHFAALHHQLQLIDKQSMEDLAHQFGVLAKASDSVFARLKGHWYTLNSGADGAKKSLEEVENTYEEFLSKGDDKGASAFLAERVKREERILQLQQQAAATQGHAGGSGGDNQAALLQHEAALIELKKYGVDFLGDNIAGEKKLLEILHDQVTMEQKVGELKSKDKDNAKTATGNEGSAKSAEAARAAAEHAAKMGEMRIAAEREQAQVSQTIHAASIAERLAEDIHLADEEYALAQQTNKNLIAALDKSGKDYNNQLKALNEKAIEETAQHENAVAALRGKATIEQYRQELQEYEQGERQKIDALDKGSNARLSALNSAIEDEEQLGLRETAFFRDLQTQRTETIRAAAAEDAKLQAEAGKEAADQVQKMGELGIAAARENQALLDSFHHVTAEKRVQEEAAFANQEYALKLLALKQQEAALDKGGKDYNNKLKELQNKEKQLVQQHENEITAIKDKAEMERNSRILSAEERFNDSIANGLTQTLMGHKSFAATMASLGNQVAQGMIENAIKSMLADDMTKEKDAAHAARKAFNAGMELPFPANMVAGPALGAAAFAAVMAFENGGIVPGIGRGDVVPAMLTPGETVLPRSLTERLTQSADSGGGNHYHAHVRPTYNLQALDASGMEKILDKHSTTLQKHVEFTFRKMNK